MCITYFELKSTYQASQASASKHYVIICECEMAGEEKHLRINRDCWILNNTGCSENIARDEWECYSEDRYCTSSIRTQ